MHVKAGDQVLLIKGIGNTPESVIVKNTPTADGNVIIFWFDDRKSYNEISIHKDFLKESGYKNVFE